MVAYRVQCSLNVEFLSFRLLVKWGNTYLSGILFFSRCFIAEITSTNVDKNCWKGRSKSELKYTGNLQVQESQLMEFNN